MASCYIPAYYESPTLLNGRLCLDGGVTDNLPLIDGHVRVCPYDKDAEIGNRRGKEIPGWSTILPGAREDMDRLEGMGREDAEEWFGGSKIG